MKVIVNLKGRENEFRNIAIELIKRFQNDVGEVRCLIYAMNYRFLHLGACCFHELIMFHSSIGNVISFVEQNSSHLADVNTRIISAFLLCKDTVLGG